MAQTLTDLIVRLNETAIDLDHSPASNKIRKLLVDLREFDQHEEVFTMVPTGARTVPFVI